MLEIVEYVGISTNTIIWTIFVVILFTYGIWPFTYLKKYNIPCPMPWPFIGNLPLLVSKGMTTANRYLSERYGSMAGYYFGRYPAVIVSDLDMIQKILTNDFSLFINRYHVLPPKGIFANSIVFANDDHWKVLRCILTPTFSGSHLKEIVPLVQRETDKAMVKLAKIADSEEPFDAVSFFSNFAMDLVATTAFGVEIDSQANPNCPVVKSSMGFLTFDLYKSLIPLSFFCRPLWYLVDFLRLPGTLQKHLDYLIYFIQESINLRKSSQTTNRRDMMQLMLEARVDSKKENHETLIDDSSNYKDKQTLTDQEILSQLITFLFAGHNTIASTFAFLAHSLALNQDMQDKVYHEIMTLIDKAKPDHDNVRELTYLDMCLSETLRKYPVLSRIDREAKHDVKMGEWTIPSETDVVIPIYTIHNLPEYWPDPEKFDPERFTPEAKASRHPCAYLPFGKGPRICIGQKLARMEIKMLAVNMFREFRFLTCSKTENPVQLNNLLLLGAENGIWLKIVRRKQERK